MIPVVGRLVVPLVAISCLLLQPTSASNAAESVFDVTGTVEEIRGQILTVLSADVSGRPRALLIDVSQLEGYEPKLGDPIQLTIQAREDDTYLALGLVRESPYVNGADFGVREEFTTRQDSIQAGVGNVPEDDEALAKQHRLRNLRDREREKQRK